MFSKRTFRHNKPRQNNWLESNDQQKNDPFFSPRGTKLEGDDRSGLQNQESISNLEEQEEKVETESEQEGQEEVETEKISNLETKEEKKDLETGSLTKLEAQEEQEQVKGEAIPQDEKEMPGPKNLEQESGLDLETAVEPSRPDAVARELTADEIASAIAYNTRKFTDENELMTLRDVLGLSSDVATIDAEFVQTVAQWQAENELTVDGKIGPSTAAVIGYEMLQESQIDRSLEPEAIRMLERGIVLSFSNNSYNDTATQSIKRIQFNVFVPRGLRKEDYCVVNWVKGYAKDGSGSFFRAQLYGADTDINFASYQVDSLDPDPIYWSRGGVRWRYTNVSQRRFSATDSPVEARRAWTGSDFNLNFKLQVYKVQDVPLTTSGNLGGAESKAISTAFWEYKTKVDAAGNFTH